MAWEIRGRRRYYYRKSRQGAKVYTEYIGSGEMAEMVAQLDAVERQQRLSQQAERQQELAADRRVERKLSELGNQVRRLIRLVMVAYGYRTHKRQWRKKRGLSMTKEITLRLNKPLTNVDINELNRLLAAVNTDNPTHQARAEFLHHLEGAPALAKLLGDTTTVVIDEIAQQLYGDGAARLALGVHLDNMRAGFGYAVAPQVEQMLIEQIVLCWLRLQQVEWLYQSQTESMGFFVEADYWEKRLNAAQRRYLRAIETLARVRRLGVALQINIATNGGQQVNVAK